MKKELFVNPATVLAALLCLFTGCGAGSDSGEPEQTEMLYTVSTGIWNVTCQQTDFTEGVYSLSVTTDPPASVDSVHFQDENTADSLIFNRIWNIGGGESLVLSIRVPVFSDPVTETRIQRILDSAGLVPPRGLRSVYLSDRSFEQIDSQRALPSVEPPPEVFHHLQVSFQPSSVDSCLIIRDSLLVNFNVSNADSMEFFMDRGNGQESFVLRPDSTGFCMSEFTGILEMNRLYTGGAGVLGHARLTSAYLTGRGFMPLSGTTQNYTVCFSLPDSISAWTPLRMRSDTLWESRPGGITGGLPIALGRYEETSAGYGYTLSILPGGEPDTVDSVVAGRLAQVIYEALDFYSGDFAFIEISNPDGDMVIPVFGGVFFSRGALEPLEDVSNWNDLLARGQVPPGSEIVCSSARGMLMQSLRLDPVLSRMLVSWLPLRYYSAVSGDSVGTITVRDAYLKYYLYHTELAALSAVGSDPPVEYSIADPLLASSTLEPAISGGKGVILLEYMDSMGLLENLPALLQGFTHSWSSNYWPRIYSTLLYSDKLAGEYRELLRKLFYLPGVPQITVNWQEENETIVMNLSELQPGTPFDLPMDSVPCLIRTDDTSFVRFTQYTEGVLTCQITPPHGRRVEVRSIDLNPVRIIPADFMYRRELN